jgi:hypothetical protein
VDDTTAPLIDCPPDVHLAQGQSTDPSDTGMAEGLDNCDAQLDITFSDNFDGSVCPQSLTRTWTATDDCGNESSCVQRITIDCPPTGGEGCTPGYWKNHTSAWPAPYTPGMDFDTVFGVNVFTPNRTLLGALRLGGGGLNALARHATAALLNAASSEVDYALTVAQVIALVQAAVAPGGDIEGTKNILAAFNEDGCPL